MERVAQQRGRAVQVTARGGKVGMKSGGPWSS